MEKLKYFPILPEVGEPGSERSDDVREWLYKYLIPSGVATVNEEEANIYLVATGDGGLMRAVREKVDNGKIFFGIGRGTENFLHSPINDIRQIPLNFDEIEVIKFSLIKAIFYRKNGEVVKHLAFNEVVVGDHILDYSRFDIQGELSHFPNRKVRGTSLLVSTTQGFTGYAINLCRGPAIVPLHSNLWYVCGLGTGPYPSDPVTPQKITINIDSRYQVNGYADGKGGHTVLDISKVEIMPSEKKIRLGFVKGVDLEARRMQLSQKIERGEL